MAGGDRRLFHDGPSRDWKTVGCPARLTVGVCKVHFLRNVLAQIPKGNADMVLAAIRTIFAQPDAAHVYEQFETIAGMLGRSLPKVEAKLEDAKDDLLAFASFPFEHWKKIWSTNPLERLNREVKRRTDVVGVSPQPRGPAPSRRFGADRGPRRVGGL